MAKVVVDPQSTSLQQRYAVIRTKRRGRERYPEGCVTILETEDDALAQADSSPSLHPAIVYGPSVSSENLRIYYLVQWLA